MTQNRSRNRFASAPSDKERWKLDGFGCRFYSLGSFMLSVMGVYHRYTWNKVLPYLNMLPEENQQRAYCSSAHHQMAKQSMMAITLCRHTCLSLANITEDNRIKDLPFDSISLFDTSTDEILDSPQKMRKTMWDYNTEGYYGGPGSTGGTSMLTNHTGCLLIAQGFSLQPCYTSIGLKKAANAHYSQLEGLKGSQSSTFDYGRLKTPPTIWTQFTTRFPST
ncbi:hypothetical protein JRQ81_019030 [Phrynocephalus forsythii]|uniref:Uncharacterized protein n=1 Tax=Phrynocephalus forsythii TaxID=171643 RepID=A0A9Q1AZV7_9SAUR|nr:hypothetical protein JRQ81_019030 [Phrynocephalus forsythii]